MSPFEEHTEHDKEICQTIENLFRYGLPNTSYLSIGKYDKIIVFFMAKDN